MDGVGALRLDEGGSGGEAFELVGLDDGHAGALDGDPAVAAELIEEAGNSFAGGAGHIGDFFVGEGHGEADLGLSVGGRAAPVEKQAGQAAGGGAGEGKTLGVVEDGEIFTGEGLRGVHGGDAVAAEEVDELLLADGFDLAGLDGFGGNLMGDVGEDGRETHDVAGAGDLEDHGLAVAGGSGDFDLAEADNKDVAGRVTLGEEFGSAGMAHHDSDAVIVGKGLGCEIAEHPQMAMLTIQTIFRGVEGLE